METPVLCGPASITWRACPCKFSQVPLLCWGESSADTWKSSSSRVHITGSVRVLEYIHLDKDFLPSPEIHLLWKNILYTDFGDAILDCDEAFENVVDFVRTRSGPSSSHDIPTTWPSFTHSLSRLTRKKHSGWSDFWSINSDAGSRPYYFLLFRPQPAIPRVDLDDDEDDEDDEEYESHHHSLSDSVELQLAVDAEINAARRAGNK